MAAITSAVIVAAGTAYAANEQGKAAKAGQKGAQQSIDEQRRQYDQTRQDQMPWLQAGNWALDEQKKFLGGDWSGFQNSPDYKFAVDQGFKGLERGFAAGGAMGSGGADADRIALGQGLATQFSSNYWSKLAGLSNTGQATANNLGTFGQNAANQIGNEYGNMANARASSYAANANAFAGVAGAFGDWYGANSKRNGGGTGWYLGNNPGKG